MLKDIPEDVLLRFIGSYLSKREQYRLFSLCTAWKPLLLQCRSIYLEEVIGSQDKIHRKYSHNANQWLCFHSSEAFRKKCLAILDVTLPDDSSLSNGSLVSNIRRPLRFKLTMETFFKYFDLCMRFVPLCASIEVHTYDIRVYSSECVPAVLKNPTIESLRRWRHSQWVKLSISSQSIQDGSNVYLLVQRAVERILNENTISKYSPKEGQDELKPLSSLRGIRSLGLRADSSNCFLEFSANEDATLEAVVLNSFKVYEVPQLLVVGIPRVKLFNWHNVNQIDQLKNAQVVYLKGCHKVRDLSALSLLQEVTLEDHYADDLTALGKVPKLTLRNCKAKLYPIPYRGSGQQWKLIDCNLRDVANFASLERLTLIKCEEVSDIRTLGKITYLHIQACAGINSYPMPVLGKYQEWRFQDMKMRRVDMNVFRGLHDLTFRYCQLQSIQHFHSITNLVFEHCDFQKDIISNIFVDRLVFTSCRSMEHLKIAEDIRVKHLELTYCTALKSIDISTEIEERFLSLVLQECRQLESCNVKVEHLLHRDGFEAWDCSSLEPLSIPMEATMRRTPSQFSFDNFSIRTAVEIWCYDEERAKAIYGDISEWNVSNVTDMSYLFYQKKYFNSNINSWDVKQVFDMSHMFHDAVVFNQPLQSWDVAKVKNVKDMFTGAFSFDSPCFQYVDLKFEELRPPEVKVTYPSQPVQDISSISLKGKVEENNWSGWWMVLFVICFAMAFNVMYTYYM